MDSENKSDSEKTAQEKNSDQAKKTESEHISHSEDWSVFVLEYH